MTKIKKYVYWATFPLSCILFLIFGTLAAFCEFVTEGLHKYEGFMLEYKRRFPDMYYKGDGIYTSWKE